MSNILSSLTSPLGQDKIADMIQDKKKELDRLELDDDSDIMYFKGHLGIKDLYAAEIIDRMGKKIDGIDKLADEKQKHFDELKAFYEAGKHAEVPEKLIEFLQNSHRFNLLGGETLNLKSMTERDLKKMKDEDLEALATRLEEHSSQWIDHAEKLSSELSDIDENLSQLIQKKREFLQFTKEKMDFFDGMSNKVKTIQDQIVLINNI